MKYVPNILSIFRIVSSFAIVPLMMYQHYFAAFILFVLAGFSDLFDGIIAKKYNAISKIGGVLDHIGDKFLITNSLILMTLFMQVWLIIIPAMLLICRELYVSGLREFMGTQKIEMPVPRARMSWGKIKYTLQAVALGMMFLWVYFINSNLMGTLFKPEMAVFITRWLLFASIAVLWAALAASLISAFQYTRLFMSNLKKIK